MSHWGKITHRPGQIFCKQNQQRVKMLHNINYCVTSKLPFDLIFNLSFSINFPQIDHKNKQQRFQNYLFTNGRNIRQIIKYINLLYTPNTVPYVYVYLSNLRFFRFFNQERHLEKARRGQNKATTERKKQIMYK